MSGGSARSGYEGSDLADDHEEVLQEAEVVAATGSGEGARADGAGASGVVHDGDTNLAKYNEVVDDVFEELVLPLDMAQEVQNMWHLFGTSVDSKEAAGEAIYSALFEAAPSLQSMFRTPRAVMALRFANGIGTIIASLHDPKGCKIVVETLGFQHLDLEVTAPRVAIFREAIVDLLALELGARFTTLAREGFYAMLNYVGGAYIYIRSKYTDRIKILNTSWATANNRAAELDGSVVDGDLGKEEGAGQVETVIQVDSPRGGRTSGEGKGAGRGSGEAKTPKAGAGTNVPRTFSEMFQFNAAVMGFGGQLWMQDVLECFDAIVTNVANSYRLQEECDVLSLRLAKQRGPVNLGEYKAVMLASLRSLVPKDWNSAHEVAWSWLWENVERMLKALMGKPAVWEKALVNFVESVDEKSMTKLKAMIYAAFFQDSPAGGEWFKQSTTRLHFIASRVIAMTMEMYRDPVMMVEDISALGLRHVGYGIPTELFGPFVSSCCKVVAQFTTNEVVKDAFQWSLSLVSRILVRTITEGSTIVMKAINANSGKMLRKAVVFAPRGKRSTWVLNITVGTQSISPLYWAIESGSLEAAEAILVDLLVIRADRDRYYYGADELFDRHPDIVKKLCTDASALLPTLLDGLIWRSRVTDHGMRRVNYFIKYLLVNQDGKFAQTIPWLVESGDPKIICHPIIVLLSDILWQRVAFQPFLNSKMWFFFRLLLFLLAQSILPQAYPGPEQTGPRIPVALFRLFFYALNLTWLIKTNVEHFWTDIKQRNFVWVAGIPLPEFLTGWMDGVNFLIMITLILMLTNEPILYCMTHYQENFVGNGFLTTLCPQAHRVTEQYNVFSLIGVLLYFMLSFELAVFSTTVSAYILVVFRCASEVLHFIGAVLFVLLAFSCSLCALYQGNPRFQDIPTSALSLGKMTIGMYGGFSFRELAADPVLLAMIFGYMIITWVFLLNILVAQLNCSYQLIFQDMVGLARLDRGKIVSEILDKVSEKRWTSFMTAMRLNERMEFNEGDVGLPGAVQTMELASLNPTTTDQIKRFGGSTSPSIPWPEEGGAAGDEDDRFDRMEKTLLRAMKTMSHSGKKKKGGGSSTTMSGSGSAGGGGSGADNASVGSGSQHEAL